MNIKQTINQAGFTLLEVLLTLVITGVLTTAIFKTYIVQHENYMTQDDISVIQQNARSSLEELVRSIRMAGRSLPPGMDPIVMSNTNPDTITVFSKTGDCDTHLSSAMPQPSAELKCGSDVSCFHAGQWAYIYEPSSSLGEWFLITHVQPAAGHIQHNTMPLSRQYGESSIILGLEQMKYFIDNTTDPEHPSLMVQGRGQAPQVYAEDISDLQFTFDMTDGSRVDLPTLVEDIQTVNITITGRSHNPDTESQEERYRLRTYSGAVAMRNLRN